jgi:hypothetical protein
VEDQALGGFAAVHTFAGVHGAELADAWMLRRNHAILRGGWLHRSLSWTTAQSMVEMNGYPQGKSLAPVKWWRSRAYERPQVRTQALRSCVSLRNCQASAA